MGRAPYTTYSVCDISSAHVVYQPDCIRIKHLIMRIEIKYDDVTIGCFRSELNSMILPITTSYQQISGHVSPISPYLRPCPALSGPSLELKMRQSRKDLSGRWMAEEIQLAPWLTTSSWQTSTLRAIFRIEKLTERGERSRIPRF